MDSWCCVESSENYPLLKSGTDENKTKTQENSKNGDTVKLKRNVTLIHAIGIIIGTMIGSGIFVSARVVATYSGSVGTSLILWSITGLYVMLQAWCYTELGTAFPVAGGDYAYNYLILGPLPAFVVAWVHVLLMTPSAIGAVSQTAGLYIANAAGQPHNQAVKTCLAVAIIFLFGFINGRSSLLATRLNTGLSVAKVAALIFLILTGAVQLAKGGTKLFEHAFEGTTTDAGLLSRAVLAAYFAYKGWDLPLAMVISIMTVSAVYVSTNAAYFSALSINELKASEAVALTFIEKTVGGGLVGVMSLCVALSCMGGVNSHSMTDSRYLFAAARQKQVPSVLGMISINYSTPIPALILMMSVFTVFALIPSVELLLQCSSLALQVKLVITISALLVFKWRRPDVERPVIVPWVAVVTCLLSLLLLIGLNMYSAPLQTSIGLFLCSLSLPVYGIVELINRRHWSSSCLDSFTEFVQKLLLVVPETETENTSSKSR